ncbi:response regulator [Szabonella alba]|uniref:histidine kinase n=1 Tax=Szabonella alba TaxID=2804194 RepID=A0A8K0VCC6_9RHOB|nr:response regulator [Szabonella alba]MBL4919298.1 response regulator [Szabonella alba]
MTRILIVDDKEENRYFLEVLLKGHGFIPVTARHGAEALAIARNDPPDLVISDLLMPVMDGYTLLRHWRSDARLGEKPFIVYTATYTEPEDERLALDLGADAFILKPADPEEFLVQVNKVLSTRGKGPRRMQEKVPNPESHETFKAYSDTLIRKLEEKSLQLEEANRSLQADIEKHLRTEEALRRSEAEFRVLADAMPQIVWVSDSAGGVTSFNRLWSQYTGLDQDAGLKNRWANLLPPEYRAAELEKWAIAIGTGSTYVSEIELRRHDGEFRWWLARALPVPGTDGHPEKWIGTFTDIHDLKVTQESLRRSQRLEVVGQLTGGIAHDFNNILQIILVNVENLEDSEKLPPGLKSVIAGIGHAVDRAADLIRRLMAFSRRQSLRPEVTDVNDLIRNTGKLLRLALGDEIELVETLSPTLSKVSIDRSQLEAALVNLCVNARDAMPTGGVLTVDTRNVTLDSPLAAQFPETAEGDYVQIVVTDTGMGIAPEHLDMVFEPFFTTKEEGKGTGLGLSMVYGFMKQSKGHVTIDSRKGHGTTVTLFLPSILDEPAPAAVPQEQSVEVRTGHVLLVEDNPDVRTSVRRQLERIGFRVSEAESASDALIACALQEPPFDLLLSDIAMPGDSNGRVLVEEVGQRWPGMARVLMSGNLRDDAGEAALPQGDVLLLPKPFRLRDLSRILQEAMNTQPAKEP